MKIAGAKQLGVKRYCGIKGIIQTNNSHVSLMK